MTPAPLPTGLRPVATAQPLSGFTVAVTADRRRDGLAAMLERRGARLVLAPTLRIVPLAEDPELRAATVSLVTDPPDIVVARTGVGLRGWFQAAEGWGLGTGLRSALRAAYLIATGPIPRGLTGAGATTRDLVGTGPTAGPRAGAEPAARPRPHTGAEPTARPHTGAEQVGRDEDVLARLLRRGVAGARIAVQLHGEAQPEFCAALVEAGAEVIEVSVHRWVPPADPTPLRRLVDLAIGRLVDAIAFTSAPAVGALLRLAGEDTEALLAALRTDVLAACVGPVSAAPLVRRDVPVVTSGHARLTELVGALVEELPKRAPTIRVAGRELTLRGHAAVVDGALRPLAPAPMAVLRALAATPGRVLSRAALLTSLPRGADEHAVEMAVARLRAALGGPAFVQTVIKRGYRLRVD